MIRQNYQLGNSISKATEDITLWQTEKGIIKISKNTLAIPIKLDDKRKGYIFHGHGKLLLDAIVETEEGAIGKPVEKEINEPFLMLGDTEETQQHFSTASEGHGLVFAFQNETSKLDILVARGSKLVYTARGIVFVLSKNNVVLKSPNEVVCSNSGKSVIIKSGKSVIVKK